MADAKRLADLDGHFVDVYEAARRRLIARQMDRALILIDEDRMLLYHRSREPDVLTGLRPLPYDKLKTLSHMPLAIFCLLTGHPEAGGRLPEAAISALRDYRDRIAAHAADLDTTPEVDAGLLPRRLDIDGRSIGFLDRVIDDGQVSDQAFIAYARANLPDVHASFFGASKVQLDACHAHMMRLRQEVLSPREWADLRVVVMGPHMARTNQNFLQYFSRLLHTPKYTEKRLVYFEGEGEAAALDLVGTTMLDALASRKIFDDEARLHRDVLADVTREYLDELMADHGRAGAAD